MTSVPCIVEKTKNFPEGAFFSGIVIHAVHPEFIRQQSKDDVIDDEMHRAWSSRCMLVGKGLALVKIMNTYTAGKHRVHIHVHRVLCGTV